MAKKDDLLPFDKKHQTRKGKKEKKPTQRERNIAKNKHEFEEIDLPIYKAVKERAYSWTRNNYICELCDEEVGDAGQMHHIVHRSQGGETSLENLVYCCLKCHFETGHNLQIK